MHVAAPYRSSGADLPFGSLTSRHGVAMEGYFWRFTDPVAQRVVTALIGVQQSSRGPWALVGLGAHPGRFWRQDVLMDAQARPDGPGARAGSLFFGDDRRIVVDLAPDARLDVTLSDLKWWPRTRPFGGSSWFQLIPGLNQYWHPWLLGGRAAGTATIGRETWRLSAARCMPRETGDPTGPRRCGGGVRRKASRSRTLALRSPGGRCRPASSAPRSRPWWSDCPMRPSCASGTREPPRPAISTAIARGRGVAGLVA